MSGLEHEMLEFGKSTGGRLQQLLYVAWLFVYSSQRLVPSTNTPMPLYVLVADDIRTIYVESLLADGPATL